MRKHWGLILCDRAKQEEELHRQQWNTSKPYGDAWFSLAWRCWKRQKQLSHTPCVLDDDGVAAPTISDEVDILTAHWRHALNQAEPLPLEPGHELLDLIPRLPWDDIKITREAFDGSFSLLPNTHPGDDGRPYCAFFPLKDDIADTFSQMVADMSQGDLFPQEWYSALLVFKPKAAMPGLEPTIGDLSACCLVLLSCLLAPSPLR